MRRPLTARLPMRPWLMAQRPMALPPAGSLMPQMPLLVDLPMRSSSLCPPAKLAGLGRLR